MNPAPAPADNSRLISFKLVGPGQAMMHFQLMENTPLQSVIEAYAGTLGVSETTLRFDHYGRQVFKSHTPGGLMMEDDDVIQVYPQMNGRHPA